ncbi:MAG: TonB-dependent receptor [Acidimicrobiia bacterium]|nr:TonB-dependent receptor [Acidimicrobiia bacterium]
MQFRRLCALALVAFGALTGPAFAQSQAINGTIEGTVKDASGAVLPGVTVTVTNTDTGTQRVVVTNETGVFRAPLLQLGRFTVTAELSGFSKFEQSGIGLVAGQTVVLNIALRVGGMTESVTVSADAPVVDLGKTDVGRNINAREIANLPNVSRNPYNFALLQPGVTGTENSEFGVPRFSVNGQALRVNYQVDGNTNTQQDRAGLRMMPMSEVMVREVQVVTSGFAPEFGNTTGLVYNAVTPSGTNTFRGDVGYRFRQKKWSAFPFFFQGPKTDATRPDNSLDIATATLGGPIVKNSVHFYTGYERTYREMPRIINIDPGIAAQVGIAAQPQAVDAYQKVQFLIAKVDWQATPSQRLTARTNLFENSNPLNQGGGGNTALERSVDFADKMYSHAVQLVSTLGASNLNELRLQVAQRHQQRFSSAGAGTGVSVNINGGVVGGINNNIQFGKPTGDGEDFIQRIYQVVNNFTWLRGNHNFKAGFDYRFIDDYRAVPLPATYTFPNVAAYLAAKSGANPKGYTSFAQTVAIEPTFDMTNGGLSAFIQDDWKVTPNFKLLYGLRYDLNLYNKGIAGSPYSEKFNKDGNNIAPRAGFAWTLDEQGKSVLRGSSVVMYDQMLLAIIEQAYTNSGNPRRVSVTLSPTAANAPSFPSVLTTASGTQSTIFAMDPNFVSGRTWQSNLTYERAVGANYSVSIGGIYARGWDMPVINDVNHINPIRTLDDGRGVYSTAVNASTRLDPRFNKVRMVQSVGESWYKAMTLQFGKRWNGSLQFDINYTLAKGVDTAPLGGNILSVQGDAVRSDPANLARDKGPNSLDVRHTLNGSVVALSNWNIANRMWHHILNNNQVSLFLQLNSGLPVQIQGNADLNGDGNGANDRPLNSTRNSLYLPARYNVDARFSRFFNLGYRNTRLEVQAEFKNLFNTEQISGVQTTYTVNATTGVPTVALPANGNALVPTSGYEQRKFQLGFKLFF